jgi:hypothetical protein
MYRFYNLTQLSSNTPEFYIVTSKQVGYTSFTQLNTGLKEMEQNGCEKTQRTIGGIEKLYSSALRI